MMDVRKMASMGQQAMRERQSKAEKVFWPLQAGRPRQVKPAFLVEAIYTGRTVANRLYTAVKDAGLNVKDSACMLVCAKGEKLADQGTGYYSPENADSNDLEIAYRILDNKLEPIGVAFLLMDREKGNLLTHRRLFEQNERTDKIMNALFAKWEFDFTTGAMKLKFN
jgi:hypothetical protein